MKVTIEKSSGRGYCRGEICRNRYYASYDDKDHIIPKGDICFVIQMDSSQGRIKSFFCKECMVDIFIQYEKAIKEAGIYDKICIKTILE